jgi:dimethylhistidine N-methyltransferase
MDKTLKIANTALAKDVLQGLSANPKFLSSKYFYDERGDKIFQQIMQMPEYYLTDCEFEILNHYKSDLLQLFGPGHFELIELGAGDGMKTKLLLEHFVAERADFSYCPIDISGHILSKLEADVHRRWPELDLRTLKGDYFEMLDVMRRKSAHRKVLLFMGANIGNLEVAAAKSFLKELHQHMDAGDLLVIGFDLKKDPQVILDAYNDAAGITASFNLNLLYRINRELGANFQLHQFKHWQTYNPHTGACRSFLVSLQEQEVYFAGLDRYFSFAAWEPISVELSQKFSLPEVEALAAQTGFELVRHFQDSRTYFLDSVWRA